VEVGGGVVGAGPTLPGGAVPPDWAWATEALPASVAAQASATTSFLFGLVVSSFSFVAYGVS
jgi:hypothetical protein